MAELSMQVVLDLVGWDLDDKSDTKDRFRKFLCNDKWQPEQFEQWMRECTEEGGASNRVWYNALQDIVVAIGYRLGFDVEFGRYGGSQAEIAFDGLWRRASGDVLLIEVKASAWPVTSVGQLGEYVRRYSEDTDLGGAGVFGLYVIGDSDVQHLVDQIKGGQYRNQLRLISFKDLSDLWQLKIDVEEVAGKDKAADRIQSVLLPIESVNVGNFVHLILEIATLKTAEAVEKGDDILDPQPDDAREPWEKAELHAFFRHNTDWQTACLAVLALAEEDRIPANRLRRLAARVADVHIPALAGKMLKSTAGPRAGFKMRRGDKEDFIGDEWGQYGDDWMQYYWLKPQYKDWIREWVQARNLSIPPTDDQEG